jgi:hypothetical protein
MKQGNEFEYEDGRHCRSISKFRHLLAIRAGGRSQGLRAADPIHNMFILASACLLHRFPTKILHAVMFLFISKPLVLAGLRYSRT